MVVRVGNAPVEIALLHRSNAPDIRPATDPIKGIFVHRTINPADRFHRNRPTSAESRRNSLTFFGFLYFSGWTGATGAP